SSRPSRQTEPRVITASGASTPRTEKAVCDFPDPDSPTKPTTSPGSTVRETPLTTSRSPPPLGKATPRLLIDSRPVDLQAGDGAGTSADVPDPKLSCTAGATILCGFGRSPSNASRRELPKSTMEPVRSPRRMLGQTNCVGAR